MIRVFLFGIAALVFSADAVADVIYDSLEIQGSDLKLGTNDGRDKGTNTAQRALVHLNNDILELNYAGDFEGGIRVTGPVGYNINPLSSIPYFFNPGANESYSIFGSPYHFGVTNRVTAGRSGFIAYTATDYLNVAGNNAHFLSIFPFDDSSSNSDGTWKAFRLRVGASAEDRFWINKLGEAYFQGKLEVENTIRSKEVIVESTGWSDFVFEDDYDLPTLDDVSSFIDENGHLPDIPSAEEVAENGITLGEMNAKLLQKLEEMTLYVLDLQKQNNALLRRVEKLEASTSASYHP